MLLLSAWQCNSYYLNDKLSNPGTTGPGGGGFPQGCFTSFSGTATASIANYIFRTPGTFNGNILASTDGCTARSSADKLCQNARSGYTFTDNQCSNVRAFISLSSSDSIANMPTNYNIPASKAIRSVTDVDLDTQWSLLLDGSITPTHLQAAGVMGSTGAYWWSFSTGGTGTFDAANNCISGTNGTSGATGRRGASSVANSAWMTDILATCDVTQAHLLCICF